MEQKLAHFLILFSMLVSWSGVSSDQVSNALPVAASPGQAVQAAQTSSDKPLLPPGYIPPTSVQDPLWTARAVANPTWQSPAAQSTTSNEQATTAVAALPAAPTDLGDWSNTAALACILSLGPVLNFNTVGSLLAKPPPLDLPPSFAAYAANLALKFCAPALYAPANIEIQNPPNCQVSFAQTRLSGQYSNILGFPSPFSDLLPGSNWGELGTPEVAHWSTNVAVSERSPGEVGGGQITFHTGINPVVWRGDTLIHPLDPIFIYIPGLGQDRETIRTALNAGKFLVTSALRALIDAKPNPVGVYNEETQYVTVTDTIAPELHIARDNVQIEAIEPGGASRNTFLRALRPTISLSDNCDKYPALNPVNPPAFVATGQSVTLTWQASDHGPLSSSGGVNTTSRTQTFTVVDTLPPVILAPPDVVTETVSLPAAVDIGFPATFDLADLNPTVTNNACSQPGVVCNGGTVQFPAGKTYVTWTATDASGNTSQATQLVNLKTPGSNHAPTANDQTGANALSAISYEPITITLAAQDPDQDPLWLKVAQPPQGGFFHSPLYPYFIQDYRLANVQNIDFKTYCQQLQPNSGYIPTNWPVKADFMAVADDGTIYVHDQGMIFCGGTGDIHQDYRLAIFRPDGTWKQVTDSFDTKDIYIDWRNNLLYTTANDVDGVSWVRRFDLQLNRLNAWRMDHADVPYYHPYQSVMDQQGLIYTTDGFLYSGTTSLRVYDTTKGENAVLAADYSISGKGWMDLALDSQGNLYASERYTDRIYKFSPAVREADGSVTPGSLIGWLGKCDLGSGCDIAHQRSFGYSCTDATCSLENGSPPSGSLPGQFDLPRGIALDQNDILYVTDYNNLRVQRFTQQGYFAGQAHSKCDGSCFVLGDFGAPKQVTVNSNNFYILDDNADLLHVFATTPLTRLDDHTAAIVYQSRNNFTGADSFTFTASDGLASSAPGTVTINVSRNYRPPQADRDLSFSGDEDTPIPVTLTGYDPDGALDSLSFQVIQPPANGTLSGTEPDRIYQPRPDFNGTDTFTFAAYDGRFLSASETVTVTVAPVNDAPRFPSDSPGYAVHLAGNFFDLSRLAALDALTVGRGYKTLFSLKFYDPDVPDRHLLTVDWGDGSPVENEGKLLSDGTATGPLLDEGIYGGQGNLSAYHIYKTDGSYTAKFCVSDNVSVDSNGNKSLTPASVTACHSTQVTVSDMTDLLVSLDPGSDPVALGAEITYTLSLVNHPPDEGSGLPASGIQLDGTLDEHLVPQSAQASQGSCSLDGTRLSCDIGSLAPGEGASVQLRLRQTGGLATGDTLKNEIGYTLNESNQAGVQSALSSNTLVTPADFIVNSPKDDPDAAPGSGGCATADGHCTLRAAIQEANADPGAQTIALDGQTYQLASALTVSDDLSLTGLGADRTTLGGDGNDRLLVVQSGAKLTLTRLSLTGGKTSQPGAGLYLADGQASLHQVQVSDNHTDGAGGGLYISAGSQADLTDSSVTGNSSQGGSGGIENLGTLSLTNVTVSGNQGQAGGGIASSGNAALESVSVSKNSANGSGGGLNGPPQAFSLHNTLLAGNTAASSGPDCSGGFTSQGYNLLGDPAGCTISNATGSDRQGADPRLSSLGLYGGTTSVQALAGDSPAVDRGDCNQPADQRGVTRPQDGNLDGAAACDIGAFEFTVSNLFLPLVRH